MQLLKNKIRFCIIRLTNCFCLMRNPHIVQTLIRRRGEACLQRISFKSSQLSVTGWFQFHPIFSASQRKKIALQKVDCSTFFILRFQSAGTLKKHPSLLYIPHSPVTTTTSNLSSSSPRLDKPARLTIVPDCHIR